MFKSTDARVWPSLAIVSAALGCITLYAGWRGIGVRAEAWLAVSALIAALWAAAVTATLRQTRRRGAWILLTAPFALSLPISVLWLYATCSITGDCV